MDSFDNCNSRIGTNSIKWDRYAECQDIIPLWIADMDFETAPEIVEAIRERLKHPIYGYFIMGDRYFNAILGWQKRRFGITDLEPKHICYQNGVLAGVSHIIDMLTDDGAPIVLQTPGYPGFTNVLKNMNREIIANPMFNDNGYYTIDYKNLDEVFEKTGSKVLLFCNPHNQTGRVWTKDELVKRVDVSPKHYVIILADNIWCEVIIHTVFNHLALFGASFPAM